jgi:prepilin-type N-terminal cleavage/methylation domain-containing protein
MKTIANKEGFALIEVLIAMVVFTIGILGIAKMQYRAISQNQGAFDRTRANAVALAVFEELKRLPFDDPNLTGNGNLDAGKAPTGGDPNPDVADHLFDPDQLPVLGNSYQVDAVGRLLDGTDKPFQIFWNIDRPVIVVGAQTYTPSCTIRLFMYWDTPLGQNHIEMTAVKYNNIDL